MAIGINGIGGIRASGGISGGQNPIQRLLQALRSGQGGGGCSCGCGGGAGGACQCGGNCAARAQGILG